MLPRRCSAIANRSSAARPEEPSTVPDDLDLKSLVSSLSRDQLERILTRVSELESAHHRNVEGGRRGGSSRSERKSESSRRTIAIARATREMYRKFPILRQQQQQRQREE